MTTETKADQPSTPESPWRSGYTPSLDNDDFADPAVATVCFGLEHNKDGSPTNCVYVLVRPIDIRCDESGDHPDEDGFVSFHFTYEEIAEIKKAMEQDWADQEKHAPWRHHLQQTPTPRKD